MALRFLLALVLCLSAATSARALEVHQQGAVSFVYGGIGQEEIDALTAAKKDYNLEIINADETGHYTGDEHIIIRDMQGAVVLDAVGGPLMYVKLPLGEYSVEGVGQPSAKQVTIVSDESVRVHFVWK